MCRRNVFRRRVRSELGALLVTETGSEWNQVKSNRFICRCSMKRDLMTLCVDTDTVHAVCVCAFAAWAPADAGMRAGSKRLAGFTASGE